MNEVIVQKDNSFILSAKMVQWIFNFGHTKHTKLPKQDRNFTKNFFG